MRERHAGILAAARQDAEVLLLQGISAIGGYHIAQGLGLPSMGLGPAPIYPTGDFPPSTLTARSLGRRGNRAAGNALGPGAGAGQPTRPGGRDSTSRQGDSPPSRMTNRGDIPRRGSVP
jgi:hypothetical protein